MPRPVPDFHHPLEEWFADARLWRRWRYADYDRDRAARKSRAVVTMVHDEAVFLPIWLGAVFQPTIAQAAGPAIASMLIYLLMAAVLAFRPQGLFPARA